MLSSGNEKAKFPLYDKKVAAEKYPTFPRNELSKDSKGGTERMAEVLEQRLNPELKEKFQFICSRVRDEQLDPTRPKILWLHDLAYDPEVQHLKDINSSKRFAKLVFVSNWQLYSYNLVLGVNYGQSVVLKNAIDPLPPAEKPNDGPLRLIYHTTPHRGLEILVPVFAKIYEELTKDIQLDVFSSFDLYGPGWESRNKQYQEIFDFCEKHPAINYHGYQPNDVVREALLKAHVFAYPSIWRETSCIAAIEALSAGCHVVCPNYAALPETCGGFAHMYEWHEDINKHAQTFAGWLVSAIEAVNDNRNSERQKFQKIWADMNYNWDNRILQWEGMLQHILLYEQK